MTELLALVAKVLLVVTTMMGVVQTHETRISALEHGNVAVSQNFGAVSVLTSPVNVDGFNIYYYRSSLRAASSSLASFKSPNATTTLESAQCFFNTGNTGAADVQIGWGATAYATTTNIARQTVAAGVGVNVVATSTGQSGSYGNGGIDGIIPPNTFINFRYGTSSSATGLTLAPIGGCSASLRGM